jgi:Sec-independent protein translocase protein TatA
MDSFFGIGIPELVVILLLAGLIMGPQRIRQVAYTLGRVTTQLQKVSREFTRQLNVELDALEDGTLRNTMDDVRQLQQEVDELRRELANAPKSLQGVGKKLTEETEAALADAPSTGAATSTGVATSQTDAAPPDQSAEQPAQESPAETTPESEKPPLPKAIDVPGDPD